MEEKPFVVTPSKRAFVAEIKQVRYQYKEDPEDQKSTKFSLLPTGEATARVFLVGVIDDIRKMDKGRPGLTAKFRDLTAAITVKAGEFQQQAQNQLKKIKQVPAFVAMTARVNVYTFYPEGKEESITVVSLEPDDLVLVEKAYRQLWNDRTLEATRKRMECLESNTELTESQVLARRMYTDEIRASIMQAITDSMAGSHPASPQQTSDAEGEPA
jgi:RPA family protein